MPPTDTKLPEPALKLALGSNHVCMIGISLRVYCWGIAWLLSLLDSSGFNFYGNLGAGNIDNRGDYETLLNLSVETRAPWIFLFFIYVISRLLCQTKQVW